MVSPREVCYLIGADGAVLWRDTTGSAQALADSRERWEAIWRYRAEIAEVAHTHPHGPLEFSTVDTTTMAAIDAALGRTLAYIVVTANGMLRRAADGTLEVVADEPAWADRLRAESGIGEDRWPF
jgi:hypothetical protein